MTLNLALSILHMRQFQKLMHSGSSPPHGHSSYRHPPPSLHPEPFGGLGLGPISRQIVAGLQSGPLKIVPGSQDFSPPHRPVSACACPAVGAAFAAAPVTS